MKKLLATSAVALALAMAGTAAHATTFALDTTGGTASFSSPKYATSQSFSDNYTFSITSLTDLSSAVTATFNTTNGGGLTSYTLINTTTNTTIATGTSTSSPSGLKNTVITFSVDSSKLTAGSYSLNVTGKGTYGGNLTLTSSVPEVSTTAMMLGGLAFVGMMAWRRRRGDQKLSMPMGMTAA
ncbi:FxDxF family PEP-CTERM protein [Herbaspirillum sp. AP02]|uniref:FxDxF family PEP-CTERM protein n=1 Tax=unclassified Herbaspirillum TaxID=2624150 RepID=UPI0015D966B7|nr:MULTISPECIES: FxDxF family PEP-CTERM protein [unclassified Herbaspirillum]MBG7618458.1 FxDxF family PEP-CTERM protein [Herbaspirillum sp. AP02]NZD68618.1 FxDxF family PEP-CTERM protein [Herbaspirillum sp. AP21]